MPSEAGQGSERPFWSGLCLVFGPLFGLGGWMAAFTDIGAVMIYAGTALCLAGFAILPTWRRLGCAVAGFALTWGWPFVWLLF